MGNVRFRATTDLGEDIIEVGKGHIEGSTDELSGAQHHGHTVVLQHLGLENLDCFEPIRLVGVDPDRVGAAASLPLLELGQQVADTHRHEGMQARGRVAPLRPPLPQARGDPVLGGKKGECETTYGLSACESEGKTYSSLMDFSRSSV